ncbi:MAG: Ig-like domain-containing protein [Chloroflexota bacterium]
MTDNSTSIATIRFSRFDVIVGAILAGLLGLTLLFIWRGDRVGVQIVGTQPAHGTTNNAINTVIQVDFDQVIAASDQIIPLSFTPSVGGTFEWNETSLIFTPSLPLQSNTLYTVSLTDQLENDQGRPVQGQLNWQFQTRAPRLIYLAPDENQNQQLYIMDPSEGAPRQLTEASLGVYDYALSSDGEQVGYAVLREDGGSDLWSITIEDAKSTELLTCPDAVCSGISWLPDTQQRLIYERRTMLVPGAAPGPPRLWWLSISENQTVPVFDDNQLLGYGAGWSADGRWLGYVSPTNQGVQLYNVDNGSTFTIPSRMGGPPVWNPRNNTLLVADVQSVDSGFAVHLLRAAPDGGALEDISGPSELVEDGSPAWSPDGSWVAVMRKTAGSAMGKQLWIMRADGSDARPLTNDEDLHYALPAWSPDGQSIAFQRISLKELGARPSLWLLDLESEQIQLLAELGSRPVWMP